jgi:hypothetical protein
VPPDPEVDMGGRTTAPIGEYMKFIRMWLNDGVGPTDRVLSRDGRDCRPQRPQAHQTITGVLPGVIPTISERCRFFPGLKKSWSYTFMVNDGDAPPSRPTRERLAGPLPTCSTGSIERTGSAGIGRRRSRSSRIRSFGGYMDFETAAYAAGEGARGSSVPASAAYYLVPEGVGGYAASAPRSPKSATSPAFASQRSGGTMHNCGQKRATEPTREPRSTSANSGIAIQAPARTLPESHGFAHPEVNDYIAMTAGDFGPQRAQPRCLVYPRLADIVSVSNDRLVPP